MLAIILKWIDAHEQYGVKQKSICCMLSSSFLGFRLYLPIKMCIIHCIGTQNLGTSHRTARPHAQIGTDRTVSASTIGQVGMAKKTTSKVLGNGIALCFA